MNNSKTSGFSLIELSIVLIIIGLLVAGVTGGQSLIESARVRAVINEIENIKRGVNTYYVAKGRLPGDPKNTGKMGDWENQYNFAADSDYGSGIRETNAPFVDMNREGILDFDKDNDDIIDNNNYHVSNYFASKVFKNAYYDFLNIDEKTTEGYGDEPYILNGLFEKNLLEFDTFYNYISTKIIAAIDQKIDDGIYNTGSARGRCKAITKGELFDDFYDYNTVISDREKDNYCVSMTFKLDL